MALTPNNSEWISAIAKRAKVTEDAVREALATSRIVASPTQGLPRHLLLLRLEFEGTKVDVANAGPFKFEWDNLNHGLYALATERNLRGKSSVIEIIRWLLRGRTSDLLQADVLGWIKTAALQFSLDKDVYEIRITNGDVVSGKLVILKDSEQRDVATFASSTEFEFVMADFFLRELSLGEVTSWNKIPGRDQEKTPVVHSWPALAGVMYIGTDYSTLLGDVPFMSGLPARLLQMFLGLPWVSTVNAAKMAQESTQLGQDEIERKREERESGRGARRAELNKLLQEKQSNRAKIQSGTDIRERYRRTTEELRAVTRELRQEQALLFDAHRFLQEAQENYQSDRKEWAQYKNAKDAGAIFRQIEPSCCPRCETTISEQRRTEGSHAHRCFVCGEENNDDLVQDELEEALLQAMEASKRAVRQAKEQDERRKQMISSLESQHAELIDQLARLDQDAGASGDALVLDLEIALLQGQLREISETPEPERDADPRLPILKAIVRETEALMKERQEELLEAVSARMLQYANRFGIEALTELKLNGALQLHLHKGGKDTSYSKTTPGEQLRLKVAAVLALIGVAEEKGIGRHPGLLLIDSLGAQEVTMHDLEQLVAGLHEIADEFDHLQIVVASRLSEAITKHVKVKHLIAAHGDSYLW